MYRLATASMLLLLVCASNAGAQEVVDASVCDVLADPVAFDGKIVRIKGATVAAGFDELVIEGSGCNPAGAIWLAYPAGTKGSAGPAAFIRLQLAKNSTATAEVPKRNPVALQANDDFKRFDSLLATPHKSSTCLGCRRYKVTATITGRLDGASNAGVVRDANGNVTGVAGFGNLNLYRARLVLQSVSDVAPQEIDYAKTPVNGDARRAGPRAPRNAVSEAAAAFGAPGENNGVHVGFGVANAVPADDGAKSGEDSPDGLLFVVTFDLERLGKESLSKAIAHMGTHIADVRRPRAQGLQEAEARAWQITFSN